MGQEYWQVKKLKTEKVNKHQTRLGEVAVETYPNLSCERLPQFNEYNTRTKAPKGGRAGIETENVSSS